MALEKKLDEVDDLADKADTASSWAFFGAVALGIGGAILVATGVGAPLGAAMMVGAGHLMTASAVLGTAAAVARGATKFTRDPSLQTGLAIVGEVALEAAKNYALKYVGGRALRRLGRWAQRSMNRLGLSRAAARRANRLLCTFTGHPVDVLKGYLYTETVDFELPGPIPLRWDRQWYSNSIHEGPLGHGWHHAYDMALHLDADQDLVAFRTADGRGVAFDWVPRGQRHYNRLEKLSLLHDEQGYAVLDHPAGFTYRFGLNRGDGLSALTAVEDANGFAIRLHYDGRGALQRIVDSAERELTVACDSIGRILAITAAHPTEPRQTVTLVRYTYDERAGQLLSSTDALGYADQYQYEQQLLVQETFKDGLNFYFEFDGTGPEARCIRTWGDEGIYDHKLRYEQTEEVPFLTTVTNSLGHDTTYFGNENGLVVKTMDARGGITLSDYNEANELLSETDALGYETEYTYDERGNLLQTELPGGPALRREYDAHDRLTALTDLLGGQWQWQYDAAGNLLARTNPQGQTEQYAYTNGLLTGLTDARQRPTEVRYDAAHNVVEVQGPAGTSRRLPDGWGRPRKLTDVRGNVQWRAYDLLDRVTTLHEPDGNVRRFQYDAVGNVLRAQDRHHDVQYAYRGMNRMIRQAEAGTAIEFLHDTEEQLRAIVNEHGLAYRFELDGVGDVVTEAGFDGLTRRYQRDVGGRVLELTLPGGQRTRYTYDAAQRVTDVVYGDGSTETYRYRPDGALLEARNEAATVEFTRDGRGAVLTERQNGHTVSSQYDQWGQRMGLASTLGAEVRFQYDALGAVEELTAGNWQARFARDGQGLELHRHYSGGLRTSWRRDALGRPVEQGISPGGRPGAGPARHQERVRTYGWQQNDRLASIDDSALGPTRYQHDAVGNLAATRFADGVEQLRTPDAVGNLFQTAARTDRRYGPAGQLLEARGVRYAYDEAGNLRQRILPTGEQWYYAWNAAGHLAEVVRPDGGVVRFTYDALGRRISKSYRGRVTRCVWDGNQPLHEWTELELTGTNTEDVITWLFEPDSFAPLAKLQGQQRQSIVCDHLGTSLEMHDGRGQLSWAAELDSYGAVRKQKGEVGACPFRYQGQYEDVETGLYYNRFRYYNPQAQDGQYVSGATELGYGA